MTLDQLRLATQLAIGLVFAVSTLSKLRRPAGFLAGVAEYRILPAAMVPAFAYLVMALEATLATTHLSGWGLAFAAPAGTALLLTFAAAVTVNLLRDRDLACHCLGGGDRISPRSLVQLALLVAGEALVWSGARAGVPTTLHAAVAGDVLLALGGAVVLLVAAVWALHADEVVFLFTSLGCKTCAGPPSERVLEGDAR
jgi:hypothetical protein